MIDVSSVLVDEENEKVIITGVDLDRIWCFSDEPAEDAELPEVSYQFDLNVQGQRKYLYLMTRNNKKANAFKFMNQRIEALVGQVIQISENFRVKDEA